MGFYRLWHCALGGWTLSGCLADMSETNIVNFFLQSWFPIWWLYFYKNSRKSSLQYQAIYFDITQPLTLYSHHTWTFALRIPQPLMCSTKPDPWFVLFLGLSKKCTNQKTHHWNQYKIEAMWALSGIAITLDSRLIVYIRLTFFQLFYQSICTY